MNFFKHIGQSVYSPAFYAQVIQKSLGSALGYFFLLCLLLSLIQSLTIFMTADFRRLQPEVEKGFTKIVNSYPSDLVVSIHNGIVTTNAKEPFIVPLQEHSSTGDVNLLVIDTKTPFSSSQYKEYKTIAWVTKDTIFVADDGGQMKTIDLSDVSDFTLNQNKVNELAKSIRPWLALLTPLVVVMMFIGLYIVTILRLVYLFFLALIIMLITKLTKKSLTYGEAYKVGIFAMTAAFLVDLIAPYTHLTRVPFLFTLITLTVVIINFLSLPTSAVTVTKASSKPKKKK